MAASAAADPEQPPISTDSSTFTWARPPDRWPTSASAKSISRADSPAWFMIAPAVTKKGMAR